MVTTKNPRNIIGAHSGFHGRVVGLRPVRKRFRFTGSASKLNDAHNTNKHTKMTKLQKYNIIVRVTISK